MKENKQAHTPIPWVSKHPVYYSDDAEHILAPIPGQEGKIIASYVEPANASFIVQAVNEYDSHVRQLEYLSTALSSETRKKEALVEACKWVLNNDEPRLSVLMVEVLKRELKLAEEA